MVKANGGTVVGDVRVPLGTADFSSFLLQAQGSGAQVLALANAGADTSNSLKAASEFGLTKTMSLLRSWCSSPTFTRLVSISPKGWC